MRAQVVIEYVSVVFVSLFLAALLLGFGRRMIADSICMAEKSHYHIERQKIASALRDAELFGHGVVRGVRFERGCFVLQRCGVAERMCVRDAVISDDGVIIRRSQPHLRR